MLYSYANYLIISSVGHGKRKMNCLVIHIQPGNKYASGHNKLTFMAKRLIISCFFLYGNFALVSGHNGLWQLVVLFVLLLASHFALLLLSLTLDRHHQKYAVSVKDQMFKYIYGVMLWTRYYAIYGYKEWRSWGCWDFQFNAKMEFLFLVWTSSQWSCIFVGGMDLISVIL